MSNSIAGFQAPATNQETPRVAAQEPKVEGADVALLSPDRPPRVDSGGGDNTKPRRPRGFAAMDRKLVSEIARKGGKAAHSAGTAHEFSSEEAREAGRKGGRATHEKRRQQSEPAPAPPVATATPSDESQDRE
jgi:general stress protein YciG